jgi:hypothetical protein
VVRAAVRRYRADLDGLVRLAKNDLTVLWRHATSADNAQALLLDVLPDLVAVYGSTAASLAADWYDDLRDAAEVSGRFTAIAAETAPRGQIDALARWGIGPLFSADPDYADALTLVSGGMQRLISNAGRDTVTGSSIADPKARGWARDGAGDCAFCSMLIDRGAVYSEDSADFEAHDHCQCAAVPVFD